MLNAVDKSERLSRDALVRELESAGAVVRGNAVRCPWHDDQHASGSVWQDTAGVWRYRCHVCDASGDILDMRARREGRTVREMLTTSGTAVKRTPAPQSHVYKTLPDLRASVARDGDIEAEYSYTDPATGKTELLVFRLRTPEGKQFRQASPTAGGWTKTAPPKPWPLYRRAEIAKTNMIVVVEGEKKAEALLGVGIVATTSPCGAGKAKYADWTPLAGKTIVLWPDNDAKGRSHMQDVASILSQISPRPTVSSIEPCDLDLGPKEDAYDFIAQAQRVGDPRAAVLDALTRAKPVGAMADYAARLRRIENGDLACLPLPWPDLARMTRLGAPGRLVVVAGRQGAAKSFFSLELLRYWLLQGIPSAAYALEGDVGDLLDRTLAQASGIADVTDLDWQRENADIMRELTSQHRDELDRVSGAVRVSGGLGLESLEDLAAWLATEAKAGKRALFVDPVSAATRTDSPWVADANFVRAAKRIAMEYEATVILVTHLAKGADEGTPDRVAGGAAYGRFSDCVIQIQRHDQRTSLVRTSAGRTEIEHNQTLYIEKARAPGTGMRLAYSLTEGLGFREHGLILRKERE